MPFKTRNLVESFRYAFAGLWFALRRERNIRIHGIVGTLTVILAVHLGGNSPGAGGNPVDHWPGIDRRDGQYRFGDCRGFVYR